MKIKALAVALVVLMLGAPACRQRSAPSETKVYGGPALAPIKISGDLSRIDLCQAIPKELIEAVMGRKLVGAPHRFEYYDTPGTSGCWYDAGKDASNEAHFGYVVLTPLDVYDKQPLYNQTDVSGIGDAAYFNNGADARQLWVKINNKVAFVVAFGDVPNEGGAQIIASIVAPAIK